MSATPRNAVPTLLLTLAVTIGLLAIMALVLGLVWVLTR